MFQTWCEETQSCIWSWESAATPKGRSPLPVPVPLDHEPPTAKPTTTEKPTMAPVAAPTSKPIASDAAAVAHGRAHELADDRRPVDHCGADGHARDRGAGGLAAPWAATRRRPRPQRRSVHGRRGGAGRDCCGCFRRSVLRAVSIIISLSSPALPRSPFLFTTRRETIRATRSESAPRPAPTTDSRSRVIIGRRRHEPMADVRPEPRVRGRFI